jgi:oxygen-independent coproporphyrinogen III oxidase
MVVHDAMRFSRVRQPWMHWDEAALQRNVGLYLHVPFCLRRCGYCDFLTYGPLRPAGLEPQAYVEVLEVEIKHRGRWVRERYSSCGRLVDTVFIGGGTPTFLDAALLTQLIQSIRDNFALASGAEFTVEANPDTLNPQYLAALARAGVNRLSIGIQATQPRHLRLLGRTHRWDDIQPALRAVGSSGIPRWSFDLIYSLPALTCRELRLSLEGLLAFKPEHISAYELTLEPGTPLDRCAIHLPRLRPRESRTIQQQRLIERQLAGAGLYRYEVSNYAKPGAECRHNLRYWRGGDYLGLGLGAASRIGTQVLNNARGWGEYQQAVLTTGGCTGSLQAAWSAVPEARQRIAPPADTFLQARTRLGLNADQRRLLPLWIKRGWLRQRSGGWTVTSRGLNFAEQLARELD